MSLEDRIVELTEASTESTEASLELVRVIGEKSNEIDKKVNEAALVVPSVIAGEFLGKEVTVDPVNGPYKTIGAAILSVPNGGSVLVRLPYSQEIILDEFVNIGNRHVNIIGGHSFMGQDNLTTAVIKPKISIDSYNRSYFRGGFYGSTGGVIKFDYVKILLPCLASGTSSSHGASSALLAGDISVYFNNYGISENTIEVDAGDTPMLLAISGSRDKKGLLGAICFSYAKIETVNAKPLIELQYSTGTLNFSAYASTYSDKTGQSVVFSDLFNGLSYGEHGYATNLVAAAGFSKQ